MDAKITIKNYRCFGEQNPLIFELKKGFIALIGPNNSGKSSFLKFFFEFRGLWNLFSHFNGFFYEVAKNSLFSRVNIKKNTNISIVGISDQLEIFNDTNENNIEIKIEIIEVEEKEIYKLEFQINKSYPSNLTIKSFYKNNGNSVYLDKTEARNPNDTSNITFDDVTIKYDKIVELMNILKNMIYIGPFRNAINTGSAPYYDIDIGTSFISTLNSWKTGKNLGQNIKIQDITRDIQNIFSYKYFEINASEDKSTLKINIDRKPRTLQEVGSGLSQFIIVFGNAAIKKPSYILIDEPELNLHPSMQIEFINSLTSYSSEGIIFATHSIGLARSIAEDIYIFNKKNEFSEVKLFNKLDKKTNFSEFLGELSYTSYSELGFEKVLLVEGVTEIKIIQQFLRLPELKLDHKIIMIPLGGSTMINEGTKQELSELKRITTKVFCIIDSEKNQEEDEISEKRKKFKKNCIDLGFSCLILEKRATENYLTENAIKKVFGSKFNALKKFEKIENHKPSWGKTESWRIAREMTHDDIKDTDLGKFLIDMKND